MPAAILFDLDGTLLDSEPDFTLILNQLLARHDKPAVNDSFLRQIVSSGSRAMVRSGFGLSQEDPQLEALVAEFLALYEQQIPQTRARLFDDVDFLISRLCDASLRWGIMTNKPRRFAEPLLAQFESFATCEVLVCPDDVNAGKPDPTGLLEACRRLAVTPAESVYVGDHPRDIEAAANAGMPGLAVRWGYLPAGAAIEQWGASYIAPDPRALAHHLENLS